MDTDSVIFNLETYTLQFEEALKLSNSFNKESVVRIGSTLKKVNNALENKFLEMKAKSTIDPCSVFVKLKEMNGETLKSIVSSVSGEQNKDKVDDIVNAVSEACLSLSQYSVGIKEYLIETDSYLNNSCETTNELFTGGASSYNYSERIAYSITRGYRDTESCFKYLISKLEKDIGGEDTDKLTKELDRLFTICGSVFAYTGRLIDIEVIFIYCLHVAEKMKLVGDFGNELNFSSVNSLCVYLLNSYRIELLTKDNIDRVLGSIGVECVQLDCTNDSDSSEGSVNYSQENQFKGSNMKNNNVKVEATAVAMPWDELAKISGSTVSELKDIYVEAGQGEEGEVAVSNYVVNACENKMAKITIAPERSMWEKYRDLPLWQQILIGAGVIGAVGGIAYLAYAAISGSKEEEEWKEVKLLNQ